MKKFKTLVACFLVACTASLGLVGCGKKNTSYKDYIEGVYYSELADSYTVSTKVNVSFSDEQQTFEQTQKIVSGEDGLKYYSTGKRDGVAFKEYEEYAKNGIFYEHKTYAADAEEIAERGKVFDLDGQLYSAYSLEEVRRANELNVLTSIYDGMAVIPEIGEAEVADVKVKGSAKKFTLTATVGEIDNLESSSIIVEVQKKRIVSYTVDIKFKPQQGQETADYCKVSMSFDYKKTNIDFDKTGYVEAIGDTYFYLEDRTLPNENFVMTMSSGEGDELTVSTLEYSVEAAGKISILMKTKQGEAEEVVNAYIEYTKVSDEYYTETFYAGGTGSPSTTENIDYFNLIEVVEGRLGAIHLYTLPYIYNHYGQIINLYDNAQTSVKQEGGKNTFTLVVNQTITSYNIVFVIENDRVTGGTIVETVGSESTTTTYTYTYNTPAVSHNPAAAAD